jgi:hypothetical protein
MTTSCTSLHTRTRDVRWLPPRECSHASGLSRPWAKLARLVSILRSCTPGAWVDVAGVVLILQFGIEACPSAHHWGRELHVLGHTVRLIPPSYVKARTSGLDRGR